MTFPISVLLTIAIACSFQADTSLAFTTPSCQKPGAALMTSKLKSNHQHHRLSQRPFHVLNASSDPDMPAEEAVEADNDGDVSISLPTSSASAQQPQTPPTYVPPSPTRNSPPAVRQQRMDPLMASLTKDNVSPESPTKNIPLFGEVPADGSALLIATVVFAILGFVYSIVVAVNSSDQIINSLSQATGSIAQTAANRSNGVYDENVCRGLCSSQQNDVDGLRNFMEAITRSAREN